MPRWVIFLSLLVVGYGCGKSSPQTSPMRDVAIVETERLYYDDSQGGYADSTRFEARSEGEFDAVWRKATGGRDVPPARPAVNFETHMVIGVAAGQMFSGDRIVVDSVRVQERTTADGTEKVLVVTVKTIEGCRRFQAHVYPTEIVKVTRWDRVAYENEHEQSCNQ